MVRWKCAEHILYAILCTSVVSLARRSPPYCSGSVALFAVCPPFLLQISCSCSQFPVPRTKFLGQVAASMAGTVRAKKLTQLGTPSSDNLREKTLQRLEASLKLGGKCKGCPEEAHIAFDLLTLLELMENGSKGLLRYPGLGLGQDWQRYGDLKGSRIEIKGFGRDLLYKNWKKVKKYFVLRF